jgi:DNA-binding MarR family transcriptional regulator
MPQEEPASRGNAPEPCRSCQDRIIFSIRMLVRALDVLSRKLAADSGVTSPQLACLRHIVGEGTTTTTEIARNVHLSPSTVVGIIDRLEEKGLVERERDKHDRRVVRLTPTDAGKKLAEETPHPVEALFDNQSAKELTEEDYERIAVALEDIVRILGTDTQDGEPPVDVVP